MLTDSREKFETAWTARGLPHPSRSSEPGYTDTYDLAIAQNGWVMWQKGEAAATAEARALVGRLVDGLEHHMLQTRPITKTEQLLVAARAWLGEAKGDGLISGNRTSSAPAKTGRA